MNAKRLFDLLASGIGLMVLTPILLGIVLAIKFESSGPVFFRQERVGRFGRIFRIHKFRTMVADADKLGLQITVGADSRVTRTGTVLRRYKIDELAQLIDVFIGDMSLVGPRPEVPLYIAFYTVEESKLILSVRPGITDIASIEFKNENEILGMAKDPHNAYVTEVLPIKIGYYIDYVKNRSFWFDIKIIFLTFVAIMR